MTIGGKVTTCHGTNQSVTVILSAKEKWLVLWLKGITLLRRECQSNYPGLFLRSEILQIECNMTDTRQKRKVFHVEKTNLCPLGTAFTTKTNLYSLGTVLTMF